MKLKPEFSRFLDADPDRLHFAAHSHHPWPDVSYEAQRQAWVDAATLADDKWEHIFGSLIPRTTDLISSVLGLAGGETLVFAPNTHEFLLRLFSCFDSPVRMLSSDSEFHSFTRQTRRWEEEGLAIVDRVPARPYETFGERFGAEARSGAHDIIYLSHVLFDSGLVVPEIERIVASVSEEKAFFVIDGYHAFMALPVDLGTMQDRAFYIAGGYKYAMSGEGVCFMHCPPGFGPRPVDTGWYAGFSELETGVGAAITYRSDATRFAGATFDPTGIYRMEAVLGWLESEEIGPAQIHEHVRVLQEQFLESVDVPWDLVPPIGVGRGNFLAFDTTHAGEIYRRLHDQNVIVDHRGDRLRVGFGVYHDSNDVDRLAATVRGIVAS